MFTVVLYYLGLTGNLKQYAPVLLRRRAHRLKRQSTKNRFFLSRYDLTRATTLREILKVDMSRPFRTLKIVHQSNSWLNLRKLSFFTYRADCDITFHLYRNRVCHTLCALCCLSYSIPGAPPFHSRARWSRIPRSWSRYRYRIILNTSSEYDLLECDGQKSDRKSGT